MGKIKKQEMGKRNRKGKKRTRNKKGKEGKKLIKNGKLNKNKEKMVLPILLASYFVITCTLTPGKVIALNQML